MSADTPQPVVLPEGLRERVLAASRQARTAGHTVPQVAEMLAGRGVQPGCRRLLRTAVRAR